MRKNLYFFMFTLSVLLLGYQLGAWIQLLIDEVPFGVDVYLRLFSFFMTSLAFGIMLYQRTVWKDRREGKEEG